MPISIPPPLNTADYEAIEAAVMETSRGRWFLAEFARRHRHADTTTLLTALERLENVVRESTAGRPAFVTDPVAGVRNAASSRGHPTEMPASPPLVVTSAVDLDRPCLDAPERRAPAIESGRDPLAPLAAMSYEEKIALFT